MNTRRAVVVSALLSLAGSALAASNPMDNQKTDPPAGVTCKEALQNVKELKVGLTGHRVLQLLGNPKSKTGNQWAYNFLECAPPPQAGTQAVLGVAITFKGGLIAKIDYATICATGPGVSIPDKTPRKKAR